MNHLIQSAVMELAVLQLRTEQRLEEVKEQWTNSVNLPRKQKKKVRKHLLWLWNLLQHEKTLFNIN